MKSKLEELFDDENFGVEAVGHNNGIMIYKSSVPVDFLILEYKNRFDVYLNLFDEGEPPYRNILVKGSSKKLETAQKIAVRKLEKEINTRVR